MITLKKFLITISLFLLISSISYANDKGVNWYEDYKKGFEAAKKEKKKIFLNFVSKDCFYCIKMKKITFTSPAVIKMLNKNFISISLDTDLEKNVEIARQCGVRGLPFTTFFSSDAKPLGYIPGYVDSDKLIKILKAVKKIE